MLPLLRLGVGDERVDVSIAGLIAFDRLEFSDRGLEILTLRAGLSVLIVVRHPSGPSCVLLRRFALPLRDSRYFSDVRRCGNHRLHGRGRDWRRLRLLDLLLQLSGLLVGGVERLDRGKLAERNVVLLGVECLAGRQKTLIDFRSVIERRLHRRSNRRGRVDGDGVDRRLPPNHVRNNEVGEHADNQRSDAYRRIEERRLLEERRRRLRRRHPLRCRSVRSLRAVGSGRTDDGSTGAGRRRITEFGGRQIVLERELVRTERHRNAQRECSLALDLMTVDVKTVSTLQVDNVVRAAFRAHFGVKPRHALVVEHDAVALVSPDPDRASAQVHLGFDGVAAKDNELGHVYLLRIPVCLSGTGADDHPSREKAPEIAESIRPVTRWIHVGRFSATVSSLSTVGTGRKSTVSSVTAASGSADNAGADVAGTGPAAAARMASTTHMCLTVSRSAIISWQL